jgi:hypothetical protein
LLQGWPDTYFKQPLTGEEKHADNSEGIFWFGIDTVTSSNSKPGKWEAENSGCCHQRDRHTRIDPAAVEYMLRLVKPWSNLVKLLGVAVTAQDTHGLLHQYMPVESQV